MGWSRLIGQRRVIDVLARALETGRIAHAYLFHGPQGVGKRAAALAFAQALECTRPETGACGVCLGCTKVRRMLHPDVHILFPHPKDASSTDIAERLQLLGQDPYAEIDYVRRPSLSDPEKTSNKQAFYAVDRINDEVQRVVSFRPHEGKYKVVVLIDADALNLQAANAFLKMLEEPTARTVFILTSSRPERLLPTILSRCQQLRFEPLLPEAIEAALQNTDGIKADQIGPLARMAGGSYSRALALARNPYLMAQRALVLDFFRMVYRNDVDKVTDLLEQINAGGREQTKGLLDLMLNWVRDLMLYRELGALAPLVNVDQQEAIARFCAHLPKADLVAMVSLLEEAQYLLERNVHLTLVLTVLVMRMNRALHGQTVPPLQIPLAETIARSA